MTRGRTSLRRRLATVLVGVGVVSVVLLSVVTFVVAQSLLERRAESTLTTIRDDRRAAVERGVADVRSWASGLAADPGVVTAFEELAGSWSSLGPDLGATERDQLEQVLASDLAGIDIEADAPQLVAGEPPGRRAQYLYLATNPNPQDERAALDDAGDGSAYSDAHAVHHPFLRDVLASSPGADLLFVTADTATVVYSVDKQADFGVNVGVGAYEDTALGLVVESLPQLTIGSAAVVDASSSVPGLPPTVIVASAVRSESEILGSLVLTVPIEGLTDVVAAGGAWERLGLGATGQAYVVGADGTLRTEPRTWSDDPAAYLDRLEAEGEDVAADIAEIGSPVGVQAVSNPAIDRAAAGEDFLGTVRSPWGERTLAAATPLDVPGLDWTLVVEQSTSETSSSVMAFLRRLALLLGILVPLIVLVGWVASRSMTRSMRPVLGAASDIAAGDLEPDLPDLGRNELGDLARQLEGVTSDLRAQREAVDAEDRRIDDLLGAVVPARLMARLRAGDRRLPDLLDQATVVAVSLDLPDGSAGDQALILAFTDHFTRALKEVASEFGIEPVRVSADHELFLAGHGRPGSDADGAARFAMAALELTDRTGHDFGLELSARIALASGQVGTGLLGTTQASFGVWGEPVGVAATLEGLARSGEVVVDPRVAADLGPSWTMEPVEHAAGLDGSSLTAFVLGPMVAST